MQQFEGLNLYGDGRPFYAKESDTRFKQAEVLVTVKASPNPSTTYGDTVCVAGIRIQETGPEWVRLYPVPFRHLESNEKFRKYDLLSLELAPTPGDPRAESYRPNLGGITAIQHLDTWRARHPYVAPLTDQWTMCGILHRYRAREDFPSLAIIRPYQVKGLRFEDHGGWSETQLSAMRAQAAQGDLLAQASSRSPVILAAPMFRGVLRYTCQDKSCPGHDGSILDWEFTALERRLHGLPVEQIKAELKQRFLTEICAPKREVLFFVGNQKKRQHAFSILGFYRSAAPR